MSENGKRAGDGADSGLAAWDLLYNDRDGRLTDVVSPLGLTARRAGRRYACTIGMRFRSPTKRRRSRHARNSPASTWRGNREGLVMGRISSTASAA
jgi:hypothetical protein